MTALEVFLAAFALAGAGFSASQLGKARKARSAHQSSEAMAAELTAEIEHLRIEVRTLKERTADQARVIAIKSKHAQIAELASDGACLCDNEGQIEWVNSAWEQITGYSLAEVRGKKPGHVLQGTETDQNTVAKLREAISARQTLSVELANYSKDGARLWLRLTVKPITDDKGGPAGYLAIQTDLTLKRLTQKRLERMNERAELALSAGNFGIWDWWPQPDHCEWDERCMKLYGVNRSVNSCEDWMKLVHKADVDALEAHLRAVMLGKETLQATFRLNASHDRHLEIRGQLLRDEHGAPLRMTGLVRDISEELAMRNQLHLANERLRMSLRGANDGIWEWQIDDDRIVTDERWARITGQASGGEAMSRQGFEQTLHPEDLPLFRTVLDAHLLGRTPHFETECRVAKSGGGWFWVKWKATVVEKDADVRTRTLCGTYADVTEKHRTEEALRRSALLLRQMCQEIGIAAWEIDAESFQLHWTEELDLLHAAPPDFEPSLEHFLALYPADSRRELSKALEGALERGESFELEVRWRMPGSDKNKWFKWVGNPVGSGGRTVALCGLIHDVTAIREAAAQRRELDSRLAELHEYEALSTITDDLAFDLNTHLGSIIGFQELALDELEAGSEARKLITRALGTGNRTSEIIRQVLLLNKIKPASRIGVRPALLVEELCERLAGDLPGSITVIRHIDKRCPAIMGDAAQLQQAFLHIAHHAAGALAHNAGKMEVSLAAEHISLEKAATLGMTLAGGCACLEFKVTREKLSDAEWSMLFDHPAKDPGLTLTAARKILAEHQGVLSVEYHPVHGGSCRAWLPLAETMEAIPPSAAPVPVGKGERIWILDEERFIARLASMTLEHSGYIAEIFRSSQQLLDAHAGRRDKAALVLVGNSIRGEAFAEFVVKFRALDTAVPIVTLKNDELPRVLDNVKLLPEPFTAADLSRTVHAALHPPLPPRSLLSLQPQVDG